ncbi:hypothetical protein HA402_007144 [Bradysia odoriphaga]|nr:hypothetical protein HA402_007144 [Bradysia odoriphaga]
MNNIKEGSRALYIWDGEMSSEIETQVNEIKNIKNVQLNVENLQRITMELICEKPKYEVGSSAKLSFGKAPNKSAVASVWKIDNDDDEIINPDDLLDEEDKVKPDPTSLRVCGTTGKRKACKDCSCGLAEELSGEKAAENVPTQKSSCGSCYLGDAFRCASCPYLGMPAFKPGEKIQLTDSLLKADA